MPAALPVALPAELPELRFVQDHRIAGKATVPAVWLLELLVRAATEHLGNGDRIDLPLTIADAAFPRFLPADEIDRCTFEVKLHPVGPNAGLRATLSSSIALAGGIRRTRIHAELTLGAQVPADLAPPSELDLDFQVSAERVYHELIPFGPRFRNLRGELRLGRAGAVGMLRSPEPPHTPPPVAGCPYLLDSAMHLACVWGQRYAGFVAYPTGFSSRTLVAPVTHGQRQCTIVPRSVGPRGLLCDLWLTDEAGAMCDAISGLAMTPLSTGALPPAWIALAPAPS